ncbi:hypothetical protein K432DRAFT_389878 [Lepidopterella palustris CBS 459.81]|uniref:Ricin B lectin domain-containing protein n=1 Tax=Lepidopterella palustris CBS 459.81 TaxID=1314670 RepID=A0A8E2JIV2_9PEZI|nr:hypothetical protein K432DRAFT_389878 [Lepidopterella palustris CBS 459.81]
MLPTILYALTFFTLTHAHPTYTSLLQRRTVTQLDPVAFAQAQQRDAVATRTFSSTQITTASGQCLFIDELSGDFRANLTLVQVAGFDGSEGQKWDVVTKGKHDDQAGPIPHHPDRTQACLNFDPRCALENQVLLLSCGAVTNLQLSGFNGTARPLAFAQLDVAGTCLTTANGKALDQAACNGTDGAQMFTFGIAAAAVVGGGNGTVKTCWVV